jgi:predicted permease
MIDKPGIQGLNGFVFYFTLPLMLFHNMATAPLRENFDVSFVLACLAAAIIVHLIGMATARWVFKRSLKEQAIQGIACSFGNSVFIALPIATDLFGPDAALPMALLITIENGIIMPFTVALIEIDRVDRRQLWRVPITALAAVLRNPVVMSVLIRRPALAARRPCRPGQGRNRTLCSLRHGCHTRRTSVVGARVRDERARCTETVRLPLLYVFRDGVAARC